MGEGRNRNRGKKEKEGGQKMISKRRELEEIVKKEGRNSKEAGKE